MIDMMQNVIMKGRKKYNFALKLRVQVQKLQKLKYFNTIQIPEKQITYFVTVHYWFLDSGRKEENPEKTQTNVGRACSILYRQ